jgi:serine/threonine protein kinase
MGVHVPQATTSIDVYALGISLWEMLAGQRPWSHLDEPSMLAAVSDTAGLRPACHQHCVCKQQ